MSNFCFSNNIHEITYGNHICLMNKTICTFDQLLYGVQPLCNESLANFSFRRDSLLAYDLQIEDVWRGGPTRGKPESRQGKDHIIKRILCERRPFFCCRQLSSHPGDDFYLWQTERPLKPASNNSRYIYCEPWSSLQQQKQQQRQWCALLAVLATQNYRFNYLIKFCTYIYEGYYVTRSRVSVKGPHSELLARRMGDGKRAHASCSAICAMEEQVIALLCWLTSFVGVKRNGIGSTIPFSTLTRLRRNDSNMNLLGEWHWVLRYLSCGSFTAPLFLKVAIRIEEITKFLALEWSIMLIELDFASSWTSWTYKNFWQIYRTSS